MKNKLIKIGIPSKGRLFEESLSWLAQKGIALDMASRHLAKEYKVGQNTYLVCLMRPKDIALLVSTGTLDLGITGIDTILEQKAEKFILKKLSFGACKVCIAVPKSFNYQNISELSNLRIATSYTEITKNYFRSLNIPVKIITLTGSVETSIKLGAADIIVDIVETGSTLEANDLKVFKEIMPLSAVLIGNKENEVEKFLC